MMDLINVENWRGWRKLIAFFGALITLGVFGLLDKMDGSNLEVSLNWLVTAFVAGNVGEHFANGKKGESAES